MATCCRCFKRRNMKQAWRSRARRGMARLRNDPPDILIVPISTQASISTYRVSNLESLLAAASRNPATRIIILYDPLHAADMALLKRRHRIDAALPLPVSASMLQLAVSAST